MGLSNDLVSQFVKAVNADKTSSKETTVYGTIKISDGKTYVTLDGSTMDTPITSTADVKNGDRVTVMIKDHSAVVTGNLTTPSYNKNSEVNDGKGKTTKISELGIAVADKVSTDELNAAKADIKDLSAKNLEVREKLTAAEADIDNLEADNAEIKGTLTAHQGKFDNVDASIINVSGQLNAANAKIETLEATDADFRRVETDILDATHVKIDGKMVAKSAIIEALQTGKLEVTWANIDFANIDQAVMKQFYAASGMVEHVTMEDGTVTGYLIGVRIKGDLIEAGTLKVEQLFIRGTDGNYYPLSTDFKGLEGVEPIPEDSIHGSALVAESVTADKVRVSDLEAFRATIGGFMLKSNAIHSVGKDSVESSTRGSYLDSDGQFSIGDSLSYLKYYKLLNEDGTPVLDESGHPIYKLAISADSVVFTNSGRTADELEKLADHVKIGSYTDPDTGQTKPSVELEEEDDPDKLLMTNETIVLMDDNTEATKITKDGVEHRGWVWGTRANGNYGLIWKGANR